jgi:glycosyltransferase involved in cell wall biosynthesis
LDGAAVALHDELLERLGACDAPAAVSSARVLELVGRDNKRGYRPVQADAAEMILLSAPGVPVGSPELPLTTVPLSLLSSVLDALLPPAGSGTRTAWAVPTAPEEVETAEVALLPERAHANGLGQPAWHLPTPTRARAAGPPEFSPVSERWSVSVNGEAAPEITVVVLTRGERPALRDALASVVAQDHCGPVRVLVVVDGSAPATVSLVTLPARVHVETVVVSGTSASLEGSAIERVSRLRNLALALVASPLVAFLDDDNAWSPDHLSSLWRAMRESGAPAVHAWRVLEDGAGCEWVPDRFPWLPEGDEERMAFARYRSAGVFGVSDGVVRDAVSVRVDGEEHGMVDMGEWLFDRALLSWLRFDTHYTPDDLRRRVGEDDKLLERLRALGIATACTRRPTLRYRLGGFSNRFTPLAACEVPDSQADGFLTDLNPALP